MNNTTTQTPDELNSQRASILSVIDEVHKKIIGQETLVRNIIIWVITGWHILLEWVPGVAKTLAIETLSKTLELRFKRVQFTPDLLPSDLIWTQIYNQVKSSFETKKGPIFTHFLLADEINRAPSKVQSALLEAMAEKQITIWDETYKLESPFIVLATQNPIEQSWTYKLPEAELDRFMMKSYVEYPTREEELQILTKLDSIEHDTVAKIIGRNELLTIQESVASTHAWDNILKYIADIIWATRQQHKYLSYWVSPRWSISLLKWAKAVAFLEWRNFVIPEDVQAIATSVLSHRLVLNYDAVADDIAAEDLIDQIIKNVEIS